MSTPEVLVKVIQHKDVARVIDTGIVPLQPDDIAAGCIRLYLHGAHTSVIDTWFDPSYNWQGGYHEARTYIINTQRMFMDGYSITPDDGAYIVTREGRDSDQLTVHHLNYMLL